MKNDAFTFLTPNTSIVVDREGGALRLTNGRILRYVVSGAGALPSSGKRYVLFLKLIHEGQDLSILAGYELTNGAVSPLEDGGERYAGVSEAQFLDIVRTVVTGATQSQSEKGGTSDK